MDTTVYGTQVVAPAGTTEGCRVWFLYLCAAMCVPNLSFAEPYFMTFPPGLCSAKKICR